MAAQLPIDIVAVISNKAGAAGLALARAHGVPAITVDPAHFSDRDSFDAALGDEVARHRPDLVVLAGYMRILNAQFIARFKDRLLNIHPSLLPAFPGLDTHRCALEAGVKIHGCTVHFVTERLDHGPIVIQAAVPVLPDDTAETLAARVLRQEHRIYPQAIRWFAEHRLIKNGQCVNLSGIQASQSLFSEQ